MMPRWKRMLWMSAAAAAVAMVSGLWMATPTLAQIRAALVRDTDHPAQQPVRSFVQVFIDQGQVFNSGTGLAIPAGKRFVVQTVSVFGYSSDPDRITAVWLTTSNIDTYVSLDPQTTEGKFLGPSGPGSTFAIAYNRNIDFVYNAGEIPKVEVIAGAQFPKTVNIFLHGYYVTL